MVLGHDSVGDAHAPVNVNWRVEVKIFDHYAVEEAFRCRKVGGFGADFALVVDAVIT